MLRVLVTNPIMLRDLEQYRSPLETRGIELVPHPVAQFLSEEELLTIITEFDATIAGDDQYSARVLEAAAPRLKVISKWGTGLDSIDLKAAERVGIKVFNSPGAFADAVADVAMGYLLLLARGLHWVDREVRDGKWPKPEGQTLRNQVLGVVGYGAIGRAVAERGRGFGMRILANDVCFAELAPGPDTTFCERGPLLAESDYVCLCCNLTPENHHMINGDALARMKSSACLINVARGALVDEEALIAALASSRLRGAALDVYAQEPLPPDSSLLEMDNVILGSHNANNAASANDAVNRNTIRNLLVGLGLDVEEPTSR